MAKVQVNKVQELRDLLPHIPPRLLARKLASGTVGDLDDSFRVLELSVTSSCERPRPSFAQYYGVIRRHDAKRKAAIAA